MENKIEMEIETENRNKIDMENLGQHNFQKLTNKYMTLKDNIKRFKLSNCRACIALNILQQWSQNL